MLLFQCVHFILFFQVIEDTYMSDSQLVRSSEPSCSAIFTYSSLLETLTLWGLPARIAQKYAIWFLKYPLPKLSEKWHELIFHTLIHYILQNLSFLVEDYQYSFLEAHSEKMKKLYSEIVLKQCKLFELKMIILVKTATYFIGSQVKEIRADEQLQNDIYRHTIKNLIGVQVEKHTYKILLKTLISKKTHRISEQSNLNQAILSKIANLPSFRSLNRRQGCQESIQTQENGLLKSIRREYSNYEEIRYALKENLYVKPTIRRVETINYSIQEVKSIGRNHQDRDEFMQIQNKVKNKQRKKVVIQQNVLKEDQVKEKPTKEKLKLKRWQSNIEKETIPLLKRKAKKNAIDSTQLSDALTMQSSVKLTGIKNFSIHCSPKKHYRTDSIQIHKPPQRLLPLINTSLVTTQVLNQSKEMNSTIKQKEKWFNKLEKLREQNYSRYRKQEKETEKSNNRISLQEKYGQVYNSPDFITASRPSEQEQYSIKIPIKRKQKPQLTMAIGNSLQTEQNFSSSNCTQGQNKQDIKSQRMRSQPSHFDALHQQLEDEHKLPIRFKKVPVSGLKSCKSTFKIISDD